MSALSNPNCLEAYGEALVAFNELEDFMGELAEMLAHVADALTNNPDDVDLSPGAAPNLNGLSLLDRDWPSFTRLQSLQSEWRVSRDALFSLWNTLSERERRVASPLPSFGAKDPTRPLV